MKKSLLFIGALASVAAMRSAIISGIHNNNTLFLGCISVALFIYGFFYHKLVKIRWITVAIFTMVFAVLGFSTFLAVYGRRSTTTYDEEVVIVLGAGVRNGVVMSTLGRRLDMAVEYHRQNPSAIIIVSGGLGYREEITEAEAMARYLVEHGVPEEKIKLEDAAYSTYTNMTLTRALLDRYFDHNPRAVIVTSDFHMYRSARFAERVGIYATVYPASTPWYSMPFGYLREVAAVVKMWIIGR